MGKIKSSMLVWKKWSQRHKMSLMFFREFPSISGCRPVATCNIILTWADSEDANETDIHYFWLIGIITCPKMLHSMFQGESCCGPRRRPRFLMQSGSNKNTWFLLINWSKQLSPYHLWTTTIKASCFTTTTNNPPITVEYCIHVPTPSSPVHKKDK